MSPISNNRSRPLLSAISSRGSASVGPDSVFGLKGRKKSQHLSMNARDHDMFDDISGRRGSKFDPSSRGRSHSRSTVSSLPVHDKPVLDDYEDEGGYDDVFVMSKVRGNRHFDDILAGFRIKDDDSKSRERIARLAVAAGYAGSIQSKGSPYTNTEAIHSPQTTANADEQRGETLAALGPSPSHRSASSSGLSADLLEGVNMSGKSKSLKANGFSASSEGIYDNWKDIDRNRKSMPSFVSEKYSMGKERSPLKSEHSTGRPTYSTHEKVYFMTSQPQAATSRLSALNTKLSDDIWLTVSEIPLITQPTKGPPPSRPPPPLPAQVLRGKGELFGLSKEKKKFNGSLAGNPVLSAVKARVSSSCDQLQNLSMSRSSHDFENLPSGFPREEPRRNSDAAASAAAMKVAIDRVEAKFWHANESVGSEVAKSSRIRGSKRLDKFECSNDSSGQVVDEKERFEREWPQRQTRAAEKERGDKEQRRLEKENERSKQIERERQAVKRVTREACERAATEARLKAEKAAIEKAHAETRDRVERAAVQRALTEARQRAANEARETAAKAASEVRDRDAFGKSYEAWIGAERAAAEAKGRDADEVRQMATSSAASFSKDNPATSENGLDSIFKQSSQASSASRTMENSMGPAFDSKPQSRQGPDVVKTSAPSFSSLRQVPSSAAMADNLASILGVAPSREFQEIGGEAEERGNARMERHQRTQERAAKALAAKNQRDMQIQREQEERHRIAETMDIEIKRWAAGKEGNLRALLSTLQYVLWPECGWQPVSLTDLINTASVRKAYRKATLCIHPDKVQQRGANLQQKYIAENIFDLLKEAWNTLNSEELF